VTRAFVAVVPPAPVLDAVDRAAAPLRPGLEARWTGREQWHLTVQFLGNKADIDAVASALADLPVPPAPVRLGGAGAFPSTRRARVVWIGCLEGQEFLGALAGAVGARLAPLGHEPEARAYHPHLTLARLRAPADARATVAALGPAPVGEAWAVCEVVVFESLLRRSGARYVPRVVVALTGDA
jgi:2'-5' RNA ligase